MKIISTKEYKYLKTIETSYFHLLDENSDFSFYLKAIHIELFDLSKEEIIYMYIYIDCIARKLKQKLNEMENELN